MTVARPGELTPSRSLSRAPAHRRFAFGGLGESLSRMARWNVQFLDTEKRDSKLKRINSTLDAPDVAGHLGELTGLIRRIISALDDSSSEADERHVVCRRLSRTLFVAPEEPVLDWSAPMPSWGPQDFTVPPPAPSSIDGGEGRLLKVKAKIEESERRVRRAEAKLESSQGTVPLPLPTPTAADHVNADLLAQELAGRKGR